jgi:hypothetical protein
MNNAVMDTIQGEVKEIDEDKNPITISQLYNMLRSVLLSNPAHGAISISLMSPPNYEERALKGALFNPKHGAMFLLSGQEDDDDIEVIDAEVVSAVRQPEPPKEEFDSNIAEEA